MTITTIGERETPRAKTKTALTSTERNYLDVQYDGEMYDIISTCSPYYTVSRIKHFRVMKKAMNLSKHQ